MKGLEAPVWLVDPSGSMYHYETELAAALSGHVARLALFASPRQRDATYPAPPQVPPRRGLSLAAVGLSSTKRIMGVSGFTMDYYLNEAYFMSRLLLARQRPLVHIQFLSLLATSGLDLSLLRQIKRHAAALVYTVHNILPHDSADRQAVVERYRQVYGLVDHLIVHTAAQRERLQGDFDVPGAKVSVIPHGPLFHRLALPSRAEARRELGLDEAPVLLHFGQMRPYKGTEVLLQALPGVIERIGPVHVLLVGMATPQRERELRQMIEDLNIRDFVLTRFAYAASEELATYCAAADLAVMPYHEIDQSGVLLTLMALGVPIAASNVEGVAETIGQTGLGAVYEPNTPAALAQALLSALADPDTTLVMAGRARRYAQDTLSWERIAADTAAVYARVLGV